MSAHNASSFSRIKTGEWEPIIAHLRGVHFPLSRSVEYNPSTLTGPPSISEAWSSALSIPTSRKSRPRSFYLPGCSREQLRNLEECPDEIKPLAELQYLGEVWSQRNGRDWTLLAYFKTSQGGLSLKSMMSRRLREAIKNAAQCPCR